MSRSGSSSASLTADSLRTGSGLMERRRAGLAVAMHRSLLFHDAVPDTTSGAVAATSLVTPAGGRAGARRRAVARRGVPSRPSRGRTASSPTSGRPTGSRASSPSGSRAARSRRGSSTATRTCRSSDGARTSSRRGCPGVTYRDLHGEGGIYRSARLLAEASDDEVLAFCRSLVREMADHGTTALELKTGLRPLGRGRAPTGSPRPAARRGGAADVLGDAARVPRGPRGHGARRLGPRRLRRADPAAAVREGLVDAVDVYVEDIAFSLDDLTEVARCASEVGLPLRCHADQLGPSGAAEAAVALAARSADHLNHVSAAGIAALGGAPATVAVLLPTSTLFLRLVAAGRPSADRRGRGGRDRDRLQPRDVPGALDARGDRDGLFALRAPAARGARRRDGECIGGARPRAGAGYACARQARRPRGPRRRRLPAGAVPAGAQPGGPDVRRRRKGGRTLKRVAAALAGRHRSCALAPTTASAQTGADAVGVSATTIDVR